MTTTPPTHSLQLRSLVTAEGTLQLSLTRVPLPELQPGQILVGVQAAPINPSDLGLLLAAADPRAAVASGSADAPMVTAPIAPARMGLLAGRTGQALVVGNEGAGRVVAAGAAPQAQALLGRTVALRGGALYQQYRVADAADVLALPEGTTAAEGASCFINPPTALGMVVTMRREGHSALVHTAAASNLGQMLHRICAADAVPLVNIVRSAGQVALLRGLGAQHVCDSSSPGFAADLKQALEQTGATMVFDAIGGGRLGGDILAAMEAVAVSRMPAYSRYGSSVKKQLYIYGSLDPAPTELQRTYGFAWGVGGWLLTPFLESLQPAERQALQQRVLNELKTTFASRYTRTISLQQALQLDVLQAYARRATGEKVLIDPSL